MPKFEKLTLPNEGEIITFNQGKPNVPNNPIVPFIRGDGTGVDIWPATQIVLDSAIKKSYGDERKINWFKVYAGDEACELYGTYNYLPQDTIEAIKHFGVAIKGPLTTPIGGGIRSLNVALRQIFDLYSCVRPCKYYSGTPSPHKNPQNLDVIVYRENTEDIYMGIEWEAEDNNCLELINHLNNVVIPKSKNLKNRSIPDGSGIGIKPVSKSGSQRHIRKAIEHAKRLSGDKRHVTLVHKGNIMKYTEGAFRDWGYELAKNEYDGIEIDEGPWQEIVNPNNGKKIVIKDVICDAFLQQILLRPTEYDVIATMNLNGDYISDALAAMVGGIGIAPGANISDEYAVFEATHGTAPKYAGQNKVNPGSLILSAEMMLRHMGWIEAADLIMSSMDRAIGAKKVTYDFARMMSDADLVSSSGFADEMIKRM